MKKLTKRETEIMDLFWKNGAMFVRELRELYPEPRPHVNTLSTMVRNLESNGYLAHRTYGATYQYYPLVTSEEYSKTTLNGVISSCFGNSYLRAVSTLVQEEKISLEDLRQLIEQIEKGKSNE